MFDKPQPNNRSPALAATAPSRDHIATLDSLRGIAAIMIIVFHARINSSIFDNSVVRNAGVFVDFFFVLSGFVIALNYQNRLASGGNVGGFLVRRIARLWPLHVFTLMIFVAIDAVRLPWAALQSASGGTGFLSGSYIVEFLENFFLLHTFGDAEPNRFNSPNWSITAEFWTYVLFALVVSVFSGRKLALVIGGLLILTGLTLYGTFQPSFAQNSNYALFNCIYCFFLGVVGHQIFSRNNPDLNGPFATAIELALIALALAGIAWMATAPFRVISPFLFLGIVLIAAQGAGWIAAMLRLRVFRFMGRISYSIYLNHFLMLFLMYPFFGKIAEQRQVTARGQEFMVFDFGSAALNNMVLAGIILSVIAASSVTYKYVEMPGQTWLRRWLGREEPAPPTVRNPVPTN